MRDNLGKDDTLVVSIGGNDIALLPAPCTVLNIVCLTTCTPFSFIQRTSGRPLECDDCCCGCGASCASTLGTCPAPCLGYFFHMFGVRVKKYCENLIGKTKPKNVMVAMIYFPEMNPNSPSWANCALSMLGYDRNPARLQGLISKVYEEAIKKIKITGTNVIPLPLYEVLDGRDPGDYVARVEPSARGGSKMAEFIIDKVLEEGCSTVETMEMIR